MTGKTKPTVREGRMLDDLRGVAEQASAAHRGLVEAVRAGHRAGLRPTWIADATGLARSTVYRFIREDQEASDDG